MNDKEYLAGNHVFKGNLREQKERSLDKRCRNMNWEMGIGFIS